MKRGRPDHPPELLPAVGGVDLPIEVIEFVRHEAASVLYPLVVHLRTQGPEKEIKDLLSAERREFFIKMLQKETLELLQ